MKKIIIYTLHNQVESRKLLFDLAKTELTFRRISCQKPGDHPSKKLIQGFPVTEIWDDNEKHPLYVNFGYWPGLIKRIEREVANEIL